MCPCLCLSWCLLTLIAFPSSGTRFVSLLWIFSLLSLLAYLTSNCGFVFGVSRLGFSHLIKLITSSTLHSISVVLANYCVLIMEWEKDTEIDNIISNPGEVTCSFVLMLFITTITESWNSEAISYLQTKQQQWSRCPSFENLTISNRSQGAGRESFLHQYPPDVCAMGACINSNKAIEICIVFAWGKAWSLHLHILRV